MRHNMQCVTKVYINKTSISVFFISLLILLNRVYYSMPYAKQLQETSCADSSFA